MCALAHTKRQGPTGSRPAPEVHRLAPEYEPVMSACRQGGTERRRTRHFGSSRSTDRQVSSERHKIRLRTAPIPNPGASWLCQSGRRPRAIFRSLEARAMQDVTREAGAASAFPRNVGRCGAGWRWRRGVSFRWPHPGPFPFSCRLCRRPPALCGQPPLGVHSATILENSISVFWLRAGEGPARGFRQIEFSRIVAEMTAAGRPSPLAPSGMVPMHPKENHHGHHDR
ncbi:hypothetical protein HNQ96_005084 [Aminobacter lissarensis]|uniref:Uncharacterized protein n=1 Tax=Aminobacter carboxidus TaxID=376165 RepID=A0A8E2BGD6_9HYPH|nr:hypothetical protein [Aminobacter lissarensis]